jgi:flagellar hook-associated protein 3 FlgL
MQTRVTHQTMAAASARNLQDSAARLAQLQQSAQDLKKITKVSDDPTAAADSLAVRAQQAGAAQYGRNIDNGTSWLASADSALDTTTQLLRRVKDLALQGANGSMSPAAREGIATELDGLRSDLLNAANTRLNGRSIFAGNSAAPAAFTSGTPPVFTGAPGSTVERRISPDATIRVDADGAAIFGTGATNVFDLVAGIAADLRAGTSPAGRLDAVDARLNTVIGARSEVGVRSADLLQAQTSNTNATAELENQRIGIEDLDLGRAILDLKAQEMAYQTSLGVTAKVLQPTLMDFLR